MWYNKENIFLDVTFLENRYYDVVIAEMSAFFEQNGFTECDGIFKNDAKAIKIEYDEDKQIYKLLCADVTDGAVGEFSVISSYLFDETQTKNDAVSVGIDFTDSAKKALGVKSARRTGGGAELPTANGNAVNVGTLTAKLLANYPELKDTYKYEVEKKGKFLYLDFYTTYFVPRVRATLEAGNKKATKKLIDMLCEIFVSGDRASVNLVIALLAAAIGLSGDRFKAAADKMEDCPHLVTAVNNEIAVLAKNKKLQKALKFEK